MQNVKHWTLVKFKVSEYTYIVIIVGRLYL